MAIITYNGNIAPVADVVLKRVLGLAAARLTALKSKEYSWMFPEEDRKTLEAVHDLLGWITVCDMRKFPEVEQLRELRARKDSDKNTG